MEPKFVVHTTHTEKIIREMVFATTGRFRIVLYTVVGLFAVLTGILLILDHDVTTAIPLITMGLLLFMLAYLRPFIHARQTYRRNALLTDSKQLTPTELRFFEDHVTTFNPTVEKELSFTYDRFKKLLVSKHLYLLKLPEQLYLMIERGGFTVGNEAEFKTFIENKVRK